MLAHSRTTTEQRSRMDTLKQGNFAAEHAAVALVAAKKKKCSASTRMSKIGEPKVRFLSLSSLQTSRGGLLLAESALFTLLSLLFAADSGARQRAIAFFSSLYAFCHFADLRFSFFPQLLASSAASRAFPQTSTHSPATSSPCSSTRAPSALERKISLRRRGDSGSGSQASTLRQQGTFAEEHATVALVAAKKKCSASSSISSSFERRTLSEQPPRNEVSSAEYSSLLPRWPRLATIFLRGRHRQGELYSTDGQAVVSSRRNCDIKKQETGVDLAPKLPQIVSITTTPRAGSAKESFVLRTARPWFPRGRTAISKTKKRA
jgi:hypothetical protein